MGGRCSLGWNSARRLGENTHLLRYPRPSSLGVLACTASFLRNSDALHLGIFSQPPVQGVLAQIRGCHLKASSTFRDGAKAHEQEMQQRHFFLIIFFFLCGLSLFAAVAPPCGGQPAEETRETTAAPVPVVIHVDIAIMDFPWDDGVYVEMARRLISIREGEGFSSHQLQASLDALKQCKRASGQALGLPASLK